MILGIDVGGTHTDAALIENFRIRRKAKVPTDERHLLESLLAVTTEIFREEDPQRLRRVVLSTTVSTNAIVQGKIDPVGMLLVSGPGLSPESLSVPDGARFLSGCMNHRGVAIAEVDESEVVRFAEDLSRQGIRHFGVAGKFSPRNPAQERIIGGLLHDLADHVTLGHTLSGHLNFPRRIATTYLNEAVWTLYAQFVRQIRRFVQERGIAVPIYILKADGGTADIERSGEFPVQTILSGPAASIMGILATARCCEDAIALDIGGTTTDIAVFADGVPLLEGFGVTIEGHKTLIRGLKTKSVGTGGDSRVAVHGGRIVVGPQRDGPAAAMGGPGPTPTDALVALRMASLGDRERAIAAVASIARELNASVEEAARAIVGETCRSIADHVISFVETINNQPVYTIHELLENRRIVPKVLYVVGGPAEPLSKPIGKILGIPAIIPGDAEVANAVGAALARTTEELTLLADTEQRILCIAEEGIVMPIPPRFTREDAIRIGKEKLREKALRMGASDADLAIEVVESQEFNMVREFYTAGKNIRVKLQIKPGLIGVRQEEEAS